MQIQGVPSIWSQLQHRFLIYLMAYQKMTRFAIKTKIKKDLHTSEIISETRFFFHLPSEKLEKRFWSWNQIDGTPCISWPLQNAVLKKVSRLWNREPLNWFTPIGYFWSDEMWSFKFFLCLWSFPYMNYFKVDL